MKTKAEGFDLAEREWRRVTSIASPTLAAIFGIQALLAEKEIQAWQIQFITGCLIFVLIGFYIGRKFSGSANFAPLFIFMLISPILFGNQPSNPWISIGLVCMSANIYIASVVQATAAIIGVISLTIFQSWIAFQNFPSITDNRDIQYFHSYFAFIWILSIGLGTIIIRRRYLQVALNVKNIVEDSLDKSLASLTSLKKSNLEDANNLQLHGTILNTLIYFKNMQEGSFSPEKIKSTILSDLSQLKSRSIHLSDFTLVTELENLLTDRALKRVKVSLLEVNLEIEDNNLRTGIVEIIREIILNLEKHSKASKANISITRDNKSVIHIAISADTASQLSIDEIHNEVSAAKNSNSLSKLIKNYDGFLEVYALANNEDLLYKVSLPELRNKKTIQESLRVARYAGLNDFAINYARVSTYVGIFSLIGYALSGMDFNHLALLSVFNITLAAAIESPRSNSLLMISTLLSFLVIPFIAYGVSDCSQLLSLPWIFNTILTQGFLVTLRVKSTYLKWIPLTVLAIQSIVYPLNFEKACQNIFSGSLPAIPLIAVLAFVILRIRKREFGLDIEQTQSAEILNQTFIDADSEVASEYSRLVKDLEDFARRQDFTIPSESLKTAYDLKIQKIRSFLIAAEQFESEFVRDIYYFVSLRLKHGYLTRLSIMGVVPIDLGAHTGAVLSFIKESVGSEAIDLTVITSDKLEILISGSSKFASRYPEVTEFGIVSVRFESSSSDNSSD